MSVVLPPRRQETSVIVAGRRVGVRQHGRTVMFSLPARAGHRAPWQIGVAPR